MFIFQANVAKNANNSRVLSQVTLFQGIFQLKNNVKITKNTYAKQKNIRLIACIDIRLSDSHMLYLNHIKAGGSESMYSLGGEAFVAPP